MCRMVERTKEGQEENKHKIEGTMGNNELLDFAVCADE